MPAMKDSHNSSPPFKGQTLHLASNETIVPSIVDDPRLDLQTLTRTLTGNRLLEDGHPRMHFAIQRPRARSASTSICLPEKSSCWFTIPRCHEDTPISTSKDQDIPERHVLLAEGDYDSRSLSLEEVPSIPMAYDDPTASLTTLLPTPRGTTGPSLALRCSQVSQPTEELKDFRQKVDNEELYETLVQRHGLCRKEHPVTRRLSISHVSDSSQDSPESLRCPRPRRKSTSAYQSPSSDFQLGPPNPSIRTSSILGSITLSSPTTPRELCMAAIFELEETQDVLMEAWSRCCMTRQPIPAIKDLWNALYNFTYVINLFTALTATKSCADEEGPPAPTGQDHDWVRPEIRAKYMKWRTPIQQAVHRSLGIGYNGDWADDNSSDGNDDDDDDHQDQQQELYPLTPRQLKDLARVCFEASHMLRPLAMALKALLPHQRELIWARKSERWRLYLSLKRVLQEQIDECVRIARCPLMSWLRNARNQACEALGLDGNKVPGGEKQEEKEDQSEVTACGALQEDHSENVEIDDDEKSMCDATFEPGEIPRQVRTRTITFKAQYYFFCLLSARCSPDKLEELAVKVTNLLLHLEINNIGDSSLREELRGLRRSVMRRADKAERAHRRRLGLVDSVICKMTRRPFHERMMGTIKAGWENISGRNLLNEIDKLFIRSAPSTLSSASLSAEDMSVEEVETEVEEMSPLHRC